MDIENFEEYLALEEKLFKQLDEAVYRKMPKHQFSNINRYSRDSLSDPER